MSNDIVNKINPDGVPSRKERSAASKSIVDKINPTKSDSVVDKIMAAKPAAKAAPKPAAKAAPAKVASKPAAKPASKPSAPSADDSARQARIDENNKFFQKRGVGAKLKCGGTAKKMACGGKAYAGGGLVKSSKSINGCATKGLTKGKSR
jgi:pyruvate/2-oxoglutarate dehydrogenase complex dihydrolipoamide acyltransferase (E2) component